MRMTILDPRKHERLRAVFEFRHGDFIVSGVQIRESERKGLWVRWPIKLHRGKIKRIVNGATPAITKHYEEFFINTYIRNLEAMGPDSWTEVRPAVFPEEEEFFIPPPRKCKNIVKKPPDYSKSIKPRRKI